MLLRIAIGWHFFYEANDKLDSVAKGQKPFSAEAYLRGATGPLAPFFRGMIPDVDSKAKLDPAQLKASWKAAIDRIAGHYSFDDAQRAEAETILASTSATADAWFLERENAEKVKKYLDQIAKVEQTFARTDRTSYETERVYAARKDLEADRKDLVQVVDTWTGALTEAVIKLARPEQVEAAAVPYSPEPSEIDRINRTTMYGMWAVGLCLMLGLLTPVAALGGAAFLALFYFSMPPWPGLPENPLAEGHYLIVNKNLIELFACLVLASTPSGLWVGVDAVLFGWIGRSRRAAERAAQDTPTALEPGRAG